MEDVASQLAVIMHKEELRAAQQKAGMKPRHDFKHMILAGPPGTGKSTLMDAVAEVLSLIGSTASANVHKIRPTDIEGQYLGDATKHINEQLAATKGGVMLIDEAHQFLNNEYTQNGLRALVDVLADPDRDEVIVIAGYPDAITETFKEVDPGLESRFKYRMDFNRFTFDQMVDAANWQMKQASLRNSGPKARDAMEDAVEAISDMEGHASGRDIDYLISYALSSLGERHHKSAKTPIDVLTATDWQKAKATFLKNRER